MATEAVITVMVEQLVNILYKQAIQQTDLLTGVEKKVHNLLDNLKSIQSVIADADKRRITDESVKAWVHDLEDVSYEMYDVLDEWNYMILKQEIEGTNNGNVASPFINKQRVCYFVSPSCFCFKQVLVRRDIAKKIKEISGSLDSIVKRKENFSFLTCSGIGSSSQEWKRVQTSSLVDESEVPGRDSEKKSLVSQLLSKSGEQEKIDTQILALIGSGGIGKTTLAQFGYNNVQVKGYFEIRVWVCVPDPFDEIRIAKAILETLESSSPNLNELNTLQERIKDITYGKKILLVLDDVWTDDERHWNLLKCPFKDCAPGSRILVTTRNKMVAVRAGAIPIDLGGLHPLDSWFLFHHIAFAGRNETECGTLENIGKEIVKKCEGLPLAIRALGSLLHSKTNIDDWQKVMDSNTWKLKVSTIEIFPHLYLSYNGLSSQMKRCFLYCAVFPKDERIEVDDLIRLWMAQGYINSSKSADEMEAYGRDIFENLAMRSFFQDFEKDVYGERIMYCKLHRIMHDFAQYLMERECLIVDKTRKEKLRDNVRHLTSLVSEGSINVVPRCNVVQLRSFLAEHLDVESLNNHLLNNLKRVRVLKLDRCNLKEIPIEIGDLIHLRYLRMRANWDLKQLPKTICDLYNLQTLDIGHCYRIQELPSGIEKLTKLRHLINNFFPMKFPVGIGQITCLQTLSIFTTGIGYNRLADLKNLNQLRGSLTICSKSDLDDTIDAQNADLKSKKHIQELTFDFEELMTVTEEVMEALEPPPYLKMLTCWYHVGTKIPKWMISLKGLITLELAYSPELTAMPSLGMLPILENLSIKMSPKSKFLGPAFWERNGFLKLKELKFGHFGGHENPLLSPYRYDYPRKEEEWEEWEALEPSPNLEILKIDGYGKAVLPRWIMSLNNLRELTLDYCFNLVTLPPLGVLPFLEKLQIRKIGELKFVGATVWE